MAGGQIHCDLKALIHRYTLNPSEGIYNTNNPSLEHGGSVFKLKSKEHFSQAPESHSHPDNTIYVQWVARVGQFVYIRDI